MSDIEITLDGLDGVIDEIEKELGRNAEKIMGKACAIIEEDAKKNAPKDTGALRRSITSEIEKDNNSIRGVVFSNLEYAPYIEYGTGLFASSGGRKTPWSYEDDEGNWHTTNGMKPHPYLNPAIDDNRDKIIRMITEGIVK